MTVYCCKLVQSINNRPHDERGGICADIVPDTDEQRRLGGILSINGLQLHGDG